MTAEKGFTVLLKDKDDAGIARGSSYIQGNWEKKVKRKRMTVSCIFSTSSEPTI